VAQFDAMLEAFLAPEEGLALVPRLVPSTLAAAARTQIRVALDQTDWRIRGPVGASPILGRKPTTLESRIKKLGRSRPR
jgi:transcriptional regulator with GAF, ATPase, and Fis domain